MSEYTLADIKTGKVRSAIFTQHGFYLDFYDQPGKHSALSGTHLGQAEQHALVEHGVPCFHFEKNDPINMPIIRGYDYEPLPWSMINRVTPEIGHSILAMACDRHVNFDPIKIPLPLFTENAQKHLIAAAEKAGRSDMLVQMPVPNAETMYQQPDRYYREVIAQIVPEKMRTMAEGILAHRDKAETQIKIAEANPDNLSKDEVFKAKYTLGKQIDLLNSHLSKINEAVLIGKANDWNPKQTMEHAKAAIKHLNAGIQQDIATRKQEANPSDLARAEICQKIDNFIEKIFRTVQESLNYSL
ncbi:MAG: hypothetical protein RSD49_18025 [Hafnia sp.]